MLPRPCQTCCPFSGRPRKRLWTGEQLQPDTVSTLPLLPAPEAAPGPTRSRCPVRWSTGPTPLSSTLSAERLPPPSGNTPASCPSHRRGCSTVLHSKVNPLPTSSGHPLPWHPVLPSSSPGLPALVAQHRGSRTGGPGHRVLPGGPRRREKGLSPPHHSQTWPAAATGSLSGRYSGPRSPRGKPSEALQMPVVLPEPHNSEQSQLNHLLPVSPRRKAPGLLNTAFLPGTDIL